MATNNLRTALAADPRESASVQDETGDVWTFENGMKGRGSGYANARTPWILRKNNRVEDRFRSIEEFERNAAGQYDVPAVDADWQTTYL